MKLAEIAKLVDAELIGDGDVEILGVSSLEDATKGQIALLSSNRFIKDTYQTKASAIVAPKNCQNLPQIPTILVENPEMAFLKIINLFVPEQDKKLKGIHPSAVIDETAKIGADVYIGAYTVIEQDVQIGDSSRIYPHVYIGKGTKIGTNCIIYARVAIYQNCFIGNNVIIHSGCVIGADGFGFLEDKGVQHKIPHIGTVVIEDDVELGANVTVDRAKFGKTIIGRGTKLDDMVHIGHNVKIGQNCVIAAQTGIAGSTKIGNNVKIAGQVGITDHIEIGDGCQIGGKSGVTKSFPPATLIFGYPARRYPEELKEKALLKKIPEILKMLRSENKK